MSSITVQPSPFCYEEGGNAAERSISLRERGAEGLVTPQPMHVPSVRFRVACLLLLVTCGVVISLAYLNHQLVRDFPVVETLAAWLSQVVRAYGLIVAFALGGLLLVWMVGVLGLSIYIVEELIRPVRSRTSSQVDFASLGLPAESVEFPASDGSHLVHGLYIPRERARSTILISPGYRRSLRDVLTASQHLWQAGHTVLAFEYYGHGGSVRTRITLGYREIQDCLGAVAYAKKRAPETRLGALGYSMGAAVSILAAAQAPDVEAVCADSAFATHWRAVEMAVHRVLKVSRYAPSWFLGVLRSCTDMVLWLRAGYRFHQVEPVQAIRRLSPRPVLLIHGLADTIVSPQDAKLLYQASEGPKALWYFPHADHLKSYSVNRAAYVDRICAFFNRALLGIEGDLLLDSPEGEVSESEAHAPVSPQPSELPRQRKRDAQQSRVGLAYGRQLFRLRWLILMAWALLLAVSLPFAKDVAWRLHDSGYRSSTSESATVETTMISTLHRPATQLIAVFSSSSTLVREKAYQEELQGFVARLRGVAHVSAVSVGSESGDGRTTFVSIGIDQDKDAVAERLPEFRALLPHSGPARVSLTGDAAVASEIQGDTQTDTERAELIAMPVTLLALLWVFGSVVSAALPLVLAGVAVAVALGIISLLTFVFSINVFAQSLVSIIGLGLSIDYSIFIIRRYREQLGKGNSPRDALAVTMATAGEAICFSGCIVLVGFSSLVLLGIPVMTSLGLAGMASATCAILTAMTLLPALLGILGRGINVWRLPGALGRQASSAPSRLWKRWALLVMRKPVVSLVVALIALLGLSWPTLALHPGLPGVTALPAQSEARSGVETLHREFPNVIDDPLYVLVRTEDGSNMLAPSNLARLEDLTSWIGKQPSIAEVEGLTRPPQAQNARPLPASQLLEFYATGQYAFSPALRSLVASTTHGDTTLLVIKPSSQAGSDADQAVIDRLRAIDPGVREGFVTQVGGARAINLDFNRELYGNSARALAFILCSTYLLLLLLFRSIILPLKAIVVNLLSLGASYGSLVWVFQWGHLSQVLGFSSDGSVDRFIPMVLFVTLSGLSMDYETFLLSRIREEFRRTGKNTIATANGLQKTGGIITHAALLFMLVSASFLVTNLTITKQLGLGITVAVLVDATLVRCLLVPATMRLLGQWNWWFPSKRSVTVLAQMKEG